MQVLESLELFADLISHAVTLTLRHLSMLACGHAEVWLTC